MKQMARPLIRAASLSGATTSRRCASALGTRRRAALSGRRFAPTERICWERPSTCPARRGKVSLVDLRVVLCDLHSFLCTRITWHCSCISQRSHRTNPACGGCLRTTGAGRTSWTIFTKLNCSRRLAAGDGTPARTSCNRYCSNGYNVGDW